MNGKKVGCYVTVKDAATQAVSLEVNEEKEQEEKCVKCGSVTTSKEEKCQKCGYCYDEPYVPYFGAISFGELEEMQKAEQAAWDIDRLTDQFLAIAGNIARDTAVSYTHLTLPTTPYV